MNLGVRQQLDYELYSNKDRAEQVRALFTPEVVSKAAGSMEQASTQAELELCANFILYGKDEETGKNFCQTKEINIDAAHSSFKRKNDESLDALYEEEGFREERLKPLGKSIYKQYKPKIDREKDKDILGLKDLWVVIDSLAAKVKKCKEEKKLGLEYYQNNHLLIELRKEQYAVKDMATEPPTFSMYTSPAPPPAELYEDTGYKVDWAQELEYNSFLLEKMRREGYSEAELARIEKLIENDKKHLEKGEDWSWVDVSPNAVDLGNPAHIYALLEMYGTLKENSDEDLNADCKMLLWDLEKAIDNSQLTDIRWHILIRKIDRATNNEIADELQAMFGVIYSPNYISTIYKQMVCKKIADTARLMKDEWDNRKHPEKFKVCKTCGKRYLKDYRCFVKSTAAFDGLKNQCKWCDKKQRDRKKN